jgi:hypothetical protein
MKQSQNCLSLILSLCALPALALDITNTTCTAPSAPANATGASAALYSAVLPGNIVYWRAGSFTPATSWADLTSSTNVATATARGLILDLRSNTSPEDFGGALQVAGFLTRGQTSTPFQPAAYRTPSASMAMLIVLTNHETRGAAETLAGTLQAGGALVMGEATGGLHPVTPDVTTTANAKDEAVSLALIDRQQVASVITETAARQRMSEAALVKGQDPEQDAFIASHEQTAPAATVPATCDMALVEALDSFKAIRVVEGQESSPQTRIASSSSVAGQTVIASSGLGR